MTQTFTVFAPFDSKVWASGTTYCSRPGVTHGAGYTGFQDQIDLGGQGSPPPNLTLLANQNVYFYGSSNIQSIKVNRVQITCLTTPPAGYAYIRDAVIVSLYCHTNANGGEYGKVLYAHLYDRVADNTIINFPNGAYIGKLGPSDCSCDCSKGIHVHMARNNPSGASTNWSALPCNQTVTGGNFGTWVYRFTGPDSCPL